MSAALILGVAAMSAAVTLVLLAYVTGESLDRHPHRVSRREYRRELEAQARAQEARTDRAVHAALEDAWSDAFIPPPVECFHGPAVDVEDVTGELVARWCPACERQLDLNEVHGPSASACSCPPGRGHQHGCPLRRDVHAPARVSDDRPCPCAPAWAGRAADPSLYPHRITCSLMGTHDLGPS